MFMPKVESALGASALGSSALGAKALGASALGVSLLVESLLVESVLAPLPRERTNPWAGAAGAAGAAASAEPAPAAPACAHGFMASGDGGTASTCGTPTLGAAGAVNVALSTDCGDASASVVCLPMPREVRPRVRRSAALRKRPRGDAAIEGDEGRPGEFGAVWVARPKPTTEPRIGIGLLAQDSAERRLTGGAELLCCAKDAEEAVDRHRAGEGGEAESDGERGGEGIRPLSRRTATR